MTARSESGGSSRRRGSLAIGLVVLNLALVGLNLAKRDVLPFSVGLFDDASTEPVGPLTGTDPAGATVTTAATVPGENTAAPTAVTGVAEATVASAPASTTAPVDDWPNGSGPVPEGPPQPRRAKLLADGRMELTGSAPNWATATKIVQLAGEKLPGGPEAITNLLTWHPDATADTQAGDVLIDQAASFAEGSAVIDPASLPTLDLAAQIMIEHPTVFAVIIGHTDDKGDENLNAQLSSDRADAVVAYLLEKGVTPGQLVVAAAGEDDPMADNTTEEGRLANRRIEIQFKNFLIADATFGGSG